MSQRSAYEVLSMQIDVLQSRAKEASTKYERVWRFL
jgi:hypothetical protein